MKLEDIGFYTLEDNRAANSTIESPLWRCELILTSRCNFNCKYCRGMTKPNQGDIPIEDAMLTLKYWMSQGLRNIRFSGGEPTIYKGLPALIKKARSRKSPIKRIAVSTNGSNTLEYYKGLIDIGVNDYSISLDSCCASTANEMAGRTNVFDTIVKNIEELSKLTYVTVGVVLTQDNCKEINEIVKFASGLGVADIRLITAAQLEKHLPEIEIDGDLLQRHPILRYRINNIKKKKPIRGISKNDFHKCPLALDDMAVMKSNHYPCIIHMREHGAPIGKMKGNIRKERERWVMTHDTFKDKICRENCLDVCVDYNNKWRKLHEI